MNVEIAQRLAELRRAKGYSQEALAHELGLSRQAISKWERAESAPDTENLIALARLYDMSLDELLRVSPETERQPRRAGRRLRRRTPRHRRPGMQRRREHGPRRAGGARFRTGPS